MEKIKSFLKSELWVGYTIFEKLFLVSMLLAQVIVYIIAPDTVLGIISGISGVISVVLCAKGKISFYFVGFVQTISYIYLAFTNAFYGEVIENIFYLVTMVWGIFIWKKNMQKNDNGTSDVKAKKFTPIKWVLSVIGTVIATALVGMWLDSIGNNQAYLDAATNVMAIFAQFLMIWCYREQWLWWIIINVICIVMWFNAGNWSMVAMYIAWTVNAAYGWYNWSKLNKEQTESIEKEIKMRDYELLKKNDPVLYAAVSAELQRQRNKIELIASENFVSETVMDANSTILTNKYAEGYPEKRYYGGCENVDVVETLAIERAKELFGSGYANVQPHSGAQANMAVFFALLEVGDRVLSMNLAHGGHLSHGSPVNMSGKYWEIIPYGVTEAEGVIDYDEVRRLALETRPKLILAGASAYARVIDFKKFREIADEVGAYLMVDMAHIAGLVAAGEHPSPIPYAHVTTTTTHKTLRGPRGGLILTNDEELAKRINKAIFPGTQGGPLMHTIAAKAVCFGEALKPEFKEYARRIVENCAVLAEELKNRGFKLVSGGTDNHLVLLDLSGMKVSTGKEAEHLLDEVGVTCNKNAVPFDKTSPFVTSGIRLGTAAVTTRGFRADDMREVAEIIEITLKDYENRADEARTRVKALCEKYPLY